jgi:hypothetical protein
MNVRPSTFASGRDDKLALDTLVDRIDALRRFVELTAPHFPPGRLDAARRVVGRAGERLALSRAHTVAALAGATGSGKSSIFNAVASQEFSAVGLRRPTTGAAHACVWGPEPAHELLDWLGVERRFSRTDSDGLSGLVLVDLPDLDSVETSHHIEADRLLSLADLIVWVLDPQKYADKVIHRLYLTAFGHHRDITVVTLHQADRLSAAAIHDCLADLGRLLEDDGLGGVPTMSTSTVGDPGIEPLRVVLAQTVAARRAALQRLSADVAATAADLGPLVSAQRSPARDKDIAVDLYRALGGAAGVPLVAQATERSYVHRAVRHVGWPVTRWVRRFRADPLGRLRLGREGRTMDQQVAATSIGPAAPAAQAAVGLALRSVGDRYSAGLPEPWPDAMLAAARSRSADIPDALDVAVARTDLGMSRTPVWWRAIGALQWLFVFGAGIGALWLGLRYVLFIVGLPEPPTPQVGRVSLFTALFLGGLLAGVLLALVARPIVSFSARRRRRQVTARLTQAVRGVGDDLVLAPLREVDRTYGEARAALRATAS